MLLSIASRASVYLPRPVRATPLLYQAMARLGSSLMASSLASSASEYLSRLMRTLALLIKFQASASC